MDNLNTSLYQNTILNLNKFPNNYGIIKENCEKHIISNSMCGDTVELYIKRKDSIIETILFYGESCAITKASSSLMTSIIKGKTLNETQSTINKFNQLIHGTLPTSSRKSMEKLLIFQSLVNYPSRNSCALLPWQGLKEFVEKVREKS